METVFGRIDTHGCAIFIIFFLLLVCPFLFSQEKLEVAGAITLQYSTGTAPVPGAIRWTGADFHGWNGTRWVSLTTGVAFYNQATDADDNVYQTIKIGTQEWMAENLKTTKYRTGDDIPHVTDKTTWSNANYGAWCWNGNNSNHEQPYGKLYNWFAVNDERGLCPSGWHVPSHQEWTTLTTFLGGETVAGGPMKDAGTAHWITPNRGGTNASGFTGLPGGVRNLSGSFQPPSYSGYWWSSTESGAYPWFRSLFYNQGEVRLGGLDKGLGFSVRCLKE